jgi:hypothetical protein
MEFSLFKTVGRTELYVDRKIEGRDLLGYLCGGGRIISKYLLRKKSISF